MNAGRYIGGARDQSGPTAPPWDMHSIATGAVGAGRSCLGDRHTAPTAD